MKWFKHYSNARFDPKIRRLIGRFGIEGYGLYFGILESISFQLETDKPIPDLEDNDSDLAEFFKMNPDRVAEIIKYCISDESGLFELNNETSRIMCLNLLKHLDNTMSNNPEIKKIVNNFKKLEETSSGLKQIRLDKIRVDKNKKTITPLHAEIREYFQSVNRDYYHNGKHGKAINDLIGRLKTKDAIVAAVEKLNKIKKYEKQPYWTGCPCTPHDVNSRCDQILGYKLPMETNYL